MSEPGNGHQETLRCSVSHNEAHDAVTLTIGPMSVDMTDEQWRTLSDAIEGLFREQRNGGRVL